MMTTVLKNPTKTLTPSGRPFHRRFLLLLQARAWAFNTSPPCPPLVIPLCSEWTSLWSSESQHLWILTVRQPFVLTCRGAGWWRSGLHQEPPPLQLKCYWRRSTLCITWLLSGRATWVLPWWGPPECNDDLWLWLISVEHCNDHPNDLPLFLQLFFAFQQTSQAIPRGPTHWTSFCCTQRSQSYQIVSVRWINIVK